MSPAFFLCLFLATPTPGEAPPGKRVVVPAADRVTLHAELHGPGDPSRPVALLFHQARSNRSEYRTIAPKLVDMGFDALAIDQRSGAHKWGVANQTVMARGRSAKYDEALPDLKGAVAWAKERGYKKIVLWGSSYSAALVFKVAAEDPAISAVVAFSPGEYLKKKGSVAEAAAQVKVPVVIFAPAKEKAKAEAIAKAVPGGAQLVVPEDAVHGSSMLILDKNPKAEAVWTDLRPLLEKLKG